MKTRFLASVSMIAACAALGSCGQANTPASEAQTGSSQGGSVGQTSSPVNWKLLGVGIDGASLVVIPDRPRALCESFAATYRPRVGVSVRLTRGRSCARDGTDPAIHIEPQPLTVTFPISGDAMDLPKWQGPGYAGVADARRALRRVPGVVGLELDVACALLRKSGARTVTYRGSRQEDVTAQEPIAWSPQTAGHYPEAVLRTGYGTGAGAQQTC